MPPLPSPFLLLLLLVSLFKEGASPALLWALTLNQGEGTNGWTKEDPPPVMKIRVLTGGPGGPGGPLGPSNPRGPCKKKQVEFE